MAANFEEAAQEWVRRAIRSEMVNRGLTYAELAKRLKTVGIDDNERNLRNKIARGTFSATLFVQCLAAMGCKELRIDLKEKLHAPDGLTSSGLSEAERNIVDRVRAALRGAGKHDISLAKIKRVVSILDVSHQLAAGDSLDEIEKSVLEILELGASLA